MDRYDFENDKRIRELWARLTGWFPPPFCKTKQDDPKTENQQQLAILETDLKKGQCCNNFEETTKLCYVH